MMLGAGFILILSVLAFVGCLSAYVQLKKQANAALRIAMEDFHDAAESLLKTPEELSNEVIGVLKHMSHTAFLRGADWKFLSFLRRDVGSGAIRGEQLSPSPGFGNMRPELSDLFSKVVVAWLTIIVNRNVLIGRLIRFELQEVSLNVGKVVSPEAHRAEALKILPKLDGMAA